MIDQVVFDQMKQITQCRIWLCWRARRHVTVTMPPYSLSSSIDSSMEWLTKTTFSIRLHNTSACSRRTGQWHTQQLDRSQLGVAAAPEWLFTLLSFATILSFGARHSLTVDRFSPLTLMCSVRHQHTILCLNICVYFSSQQRENGIRQHKKGTKRTSETWS